MYEEGFIEDAISIPIRQLVAQIDEVPTLHVLGLTNTQGFPGSFNAWVDAGLATSS